jgi:hypothetical protein
VSAPGRLDPIGGMGHHGAVAVRKVGKPGWTPYKWERVGDDLMMTGGIEGKFKNGKPKWSKPAQRVVVTKAEIAAEESRYEREHGRCRVCFGDGQEFTGWSAAEGVKYKPCTRCAGTGIPKSAACAEPSP